MGVTYETKDDGAIQCNTRVVCPLCFHLHWPDEAPPEVTGDGDICGADMTCGRCHKIFGVRRVVILLHAYETVPMTITTDVVE